MPESAGIRNNNYLNVKNDLKNPWRDEGGSSRSDDRTHAIFKNPAYGLRAAILLLRKYFFDYDLRTIAKILSRWAPATDTIGSLPGALPNSPRAYTAFVSGRMNVDPNERLDLFDEDKTLGNLSKLRDLVFAMAAYEIGHDFKVPMEHWNAALEIVQPGVLSEGLPMRAAVNTASATAPPAWHLSGAVGHPAKGAVNTEADVEIVQEMLRNVAMILRDVRFDPGPVDGEIAAENSATVQAIEAFQSRFLTAPDGVVDPGGRTWRELLAVIDGPPPSAVTGDGKRLFFPFAKKPNYGWDAPPRCYAASRFGGARAHAGCDLYAPAGTVIHAVADGVVVRGPYPFYAETYALEVDHGDFLARYGEVQKDTMVEEGDRVVAGQPIARVGHLVGIRVPSDMLHLELYSKKATGPLTVGRSESAKTAAGAHFLRRRDLMDPTPLLNTWSGNLPISS